MRDLNRKGAEKEGGTEMDAFMELSPEEATLLTPPSVSPVAQSVSPTPNKVADNQVVKVSIKMWQHPKTNSLIPWHSCRMWTKKHILRWVLVLSIFSFVFYHFFLSFFLSFLLSLCFQHTLRFRASFPLIHVDHVVVFWLMIIHVDGYSGRGTCSLPLEFRQCFKQPRKLQYEFTPFWKF